MQYGKVRGYVDDGVLTFKGVPYGPPTGGKNRWRPAKPLVSRACAESDTAVSMRLARGS